MPTRILRKIVLYILTLMMCHSTIAWALTDKIASQAIFFSQEEQTLTVTLDNIPLREVLQTLADQLPVIITLKGFECRQRLSTIFTHLPLEQGIERLLQGQDYALLYSQPNSAQQVFLKEIIVLPRQISSTSSTSSEAIVVMSPRVNQQKSSVNTLKPNKSNQNNELIQLANTIEVLVQQSDQQDTPNHPLFTQASQDQDPRIRAIARALLEQ